MWCEEVHGSSFLHGIGGEAGDPAEKFEGVGESLKKPLQGKEKTDPGNIERLMGRASGPDEIEIVAFKVAPGHEGGWFFFLVALCSQKKGAQEGKWLDPFLISKADSF